MEIVNLTPHSIVILDESKEIVTTIPASGKIARLATSKEPVMFIDGIHFYETRYGLPVCTDEEGEQVEFPEHKLNTIFIVSGLFRSGYDRDDLWQPGELVRNEESQPIGCIGLSR